jgi:hypothetical protein
MAWQLTGGLLNDHATLPERQFRVLLALAHAAPLHTRLASPGLGVIMGQANCSRTTAKRTLRALEDRGLIKLTEPAAPGRNTVYVLLIEPADAPNGVQQVDPVTGATQADPVGPHGGHPGGPRNGVHSEGDGGHPGDHHGVHPGGPPTNTEDYQSPARAPARDPDAQPDWRRGPAALEGRVLPARQGRPGRAERPERMRSDDRPPAARALCPRGCGKAHGTGPCPLDAEGPPSPGGRSAHGYPTGPMPWSGPRANPHPGIAKRGAALAQQAMAEARAARAAAGAEPPEPPRARTDDERRALALRQAAAARADRPGPAADAEPEPPAEPWDLQPPEEPPPEEPPAPDPPDPDPEPGWLPDEDPW